MSERPSPKKSGNIPIGAIGLMFSIISCVVLVRSPAELFSVFLVGGLGFAGLVISIVGVVKGSGRVAGMLGIIVFLIGSLMTWVMILDLIAYERKLDHR